MIEAVLYGLFFVCFFIGLHWVVGAYPFRIEQQNADVDERLLSTQHASVIELQDKESISKFMID